MNVQTGRAIVGEVQARRRGWVWTKPSRFWRDGLVHFVHVLGCKRLHLERLCGCEEANLERLEIYNALPGDWSEEGWFTPAIFDRSIARALWGKGR